MPEQSLPPPLSTAPTPDRPGTGPLCPDCRGRGAILAWDPVGEAWNIDYVCGRCNQTGVIAS